MLPIFPGPRAPPLIGPARNAPVADCSATVVGCSATVVGATDAVASANAVGGRGDGGRHRGTADGRGVGGRGVGGRGVGQPVVHRGKAVWLAVTVAVTGRRRVEGLPAFC